MGKKDKFNEEVKESSAEITEPQIAVPVDEVKEAPVVEEAPKEEVKVAPIVQAALPQIQMPRMSFDQWFRSKKFKPHWKGGMTAFTDTTGRRTAEDWDNIFKNY